MKNFFLGVVVPCCRQSYCHECITQWLANNTTCPNDRTALNVSGLYQPPNAMLNILNNFRIRCEFNANGCPHICTIENINNHLRNGCNYNPARFCTDCGGHKDETSAHNCIQTLWASSKSTGEAVRDILPTIVEMREAMEIQRERYDIQISSMESLIDELKTDRIVLKTKVESIAETVNTLLAKVSALETENRLLRTTRPLILESEASTSSQE